MKLTLLLSILAVLGSSLQSTEPTTEKAWRRRLSPSHFPVGSTRAWTEKRLAHPEIGEEKADHGFAELLDVYYELDAHWCVRVAYSPKSGILVCQPQVVANTPGLPARLQSSIGTER